LECGGLTLATKSSHSAEAKARSHAEARYCGRLLASHRLKPGAKGRPLKRPEGAGEKTHRASFRTVLLSTNMRRSVTAWMSRATRICLAQSTHGSGEPRSGWTFVAPGWRSEASLPGVPPAPPVENPVGVRRRQPWTRRLNPYRVPRWIGAFPGGASPPARQPQDRKTPTATRLPRTLN
jgi:hypothetical protein